MNPLQSGIHYWVDPSDNSLHFDARAILDVLGWANTPRNNRKLIKMIRELTAKVNPKAPVIPQLRTPPSINPAHN